MNKIIFVATPIDLINGFCERLKNEFKKVIYYPDLDKNTLKNKLLKHQPDILFVNPNKQKYFIDKNILKNINIKTIITASTGLNHIDMNYCKKNNISIISLTKEYSTLKTITSTAEHAFGLMLALIRKIPSSFEYVKNFYVWDYELFRGRQLNKMSIGIVGYGRLGKMMCNYCEAFGMQTKVYDPHKELPKFYGLYTQINNLKELFEISDIISLHVHLNSETKYMINSDLLMNLKKPVYLINTSRGAIVDEKAIIKSLKDNKLLGYATDVLEDELGNIRNSELIKISKMGHNIIVTPHLGGSTKEAMEIAYNAVIDLYKKENE